MPLQFKQNIPGLIVNMNKQKKRTRKILRKKKLEHDFWKKQQELNI